MITINPVSILATVVNLLILIFILRKFLVKPVEKIAEARRTLIEEEQKKAEETNKSATAMKDEYEEKLYNLDTMIKQNLLDAERKGTQVYERIVTDATKKADEIINAANRKVEMHRRTLEAETAKQLADLVATATARVAMSEENAELDASLYEKFLERAGDIN